MQYMDNLKTLPFNSGSDGTNREPQVQDHSYDNEVLWD